LLAKNPRTTRSFRKYALPLASIASKLAPTGGVRLFRDYALSLTSIASKLAPTGGVRLFRDYAFSLASIVGTPPGASLLLQPDQKSSSTWPSLTLNSRFCKYALRMNVYLSPWTSFSADSRLARVSMMFRPITELRTETSSM